MIGYELGAFSNAGTPFIEPRLTESESRLPT